MSRGNNSWRPCRRPAPARALMQVWLAMQPSHRHHLPLCRTQDSTRGHTQDSTLGTQAPSTTHTSLDLGSGVASYASTRADWDKPKLLGEKAKRPRRNSPTRPRGVFPDKASRLDFNASRRTATYDGTCQLPSTVTLFYFLMCPSPCDYKRERRATVTRVRPSLDRTPPPGTWERTPSPDKLVTPTTSTPSSGTREPHTGRRVLLLGGPNQYKSRCLLR
jgi:hypothetical protein